MSPDYFLDILFSTEYHIDLSRWVLDESVDILKEWLSKGFIDDKFDFAINTAPSHISNEVFVKELKAIRN